MLNCRRWLVLSLGLYLSLSPLTAWALEPEEALFHACRMGDLETLQRLTQQGVKLTSQQPPQDYTPLMYAVMRHHKPLIDFLLSQKIPLEQTNQQGQTALILAAAGGQDDLVELLHGAGSEINHQEKNGYTALMWAAYWGHAPVVIYLSKQRVQIDLRNQDGYTALMLAVLGGQANLVVAQARANRSKALNGRLLPLQLPANDLLSVDAILRAGANPNLQNNQGQTALMLAIEKKSPDMILRLRRAGARLDLKDQTGQTVVDYAQNQSVLLQALNRPL